MPKDENGNEITDENQNGEDAGSDRTDDHNGQDSSTEDQRNAGGEDYPQGLGDAGKRAIDRMKAERDEANRKSREKDAEIERLKAASTEQTSDRNGGKGDKMSDEQKNDGGEQEKAKTPDEIRDEALAAFREESNARVLRSEVKRVAADKLADPSDALRYLDTSEIKPDEFGDFDAAKIGESIDQLIKDRPYLAAARFQGSAEGGSRGGSDSETGQLSLEEYEKLSFAERTKARKEGRLNDALGIK